MPIPNSLQSSLCNSGMAFGRNGFGPTIGIESASTDRKLNRYHERDSRPISGKRQLAVCQSARRVTRKLLRIVGVALLALPLIARADRAYYPPRHPWHAADIWWACTATVDDVTEVAVDFRIIGRVDGSVALFIAPLGLFRINGTQFYGGVQTKSSGWPSKQPETKVDLGRGGIFSRWSSDNQPIALSYADGLPGTHYEAAAYEGNFVSVRRKVNWGEGDYTFRVRRATHDSGRPVTHAWFGASVIDKASGAETRIGALRLDGSQFHIDMTMAAFVEVYGKSRIPHVTVAFSEPRINAQACASSSTKVLYPKHGLDDPPRFATVAVLGDLAIVTTLPAGTQDQVTEGVSR